MKKSWTIGLIALVIIVGALLVYRGSRTSSDKGSDMSVMPPTTSTPSETAPATPGATSSQKDLVVIRNFLFSPATLTVKAGTKVVWANSDIPQHSIIADNGTFRSPILSNGDSFEFVFTKKGTYTYHCGIHTSMTGKVIVE